MTRSLTQVSMTTDKVVSCGGLNALLCAVHLEATVGNYLRNGIYRELVDDFVGFF